MDNRRQLARGIYVLWTHYLVLIYYIIQLFGHCLTMPPKLALQEMPCDDTVMNSMYGVKLIQV